MRNLEDALNLFSSYAHTGDARERHQAVDLFFQEAVKGLWHLMPEGPGKTVALRKLQEARLSVNACITNNGE